MGPRINWDKIRTEYITGVDENGRKHSLRKLAKKFSISQPAIEVKSRKEGWVKLRDEYLERIEKTIIQRKEQKIIDRATQFDMQIFDAAHAILAILNSRLIIIAPDGTMKPNQKLPTMEIQRIANILQMIQPVRERAVGDSAGGDESSLTELNKMLGEAQTDYSQEEAENFE